VKRPDKRAYMNSKNEKKKFNCKQGVKKTHKSLYDFPNRGEKSSPTRKAAVCKPIRKG
jgi:hypothetical protein